MPNGKPSKSSIEMLIKAYARKIFSAQQGAPIRIQQRLHDAFERVLERLSEKYPNIDMSSQRFYMQLKNAAETWWHASAFSGPARDW